MPRPTQPQGERIRPISKEDRLVFRPGNPHTMDALEKEVETLNAQIPEQISSLLTQITYTQQRLQAILSHEQYQQSPTGPFSVVIHDFALQRDVVVSCSNLSFHRSPCAFVILCGAILQQPSPTAFSPHCTANSTRCTAKPSCCSAIPTRCTAYSPLLQCKTTLDRERKTLLMGNLSLFVRGQRH